MTFEEVPCSFLGKCLKALSRPSQTSELQYETQTHTAPALTKKYHLTLGKANIFI